MPLVQERGFYKIYDARFNPEGFVYEIRLLTKVKYVFMCHTLKEAETWIDRQSNELQKTFATAISLEYQIPRYLLFGAERPPKYKPFSSSYHDPSADFWI